MFFSPRKKMPRPLKALFALFCASGLVVGAAALAQTTADFGISYGSYTGLTGEDIRVTIGKIIRIALGFLGTIALLITLYAGFLWMTAGGEVEKVDKAKKTLTGGVIGLVIIMTAFAIVSFVLNGLIEATTGGDGSGGGGGGPGGGFGGSGSGFRITAIRPTGTLGKRDVVSSVTFSSAPSGNVTLIKANILLEKVEGGNRTAVNYDPIIEHNTIRLVPPTPCPAPNEAKKCLDPNAPYVITVRSGMRNASGSSGVNCGFGSTCTGTFTTGETVATALPTASITNPTQGQSIRAGDLIQVQALLTDENGIGNADYFADGAFFDSDGGAQSIAPQNYSSQVSWDTTPFTPVKNVDLTVKVTNIDGDQATSAAVGVVVRPAHCFNAIKDADETAPDCGGADCGACSGGACTSNAQCASGECVGGVCVERPKVLDVQLRDGKPGNLVTITGEHFGSTAGKVIFGGGKEAELGECSNAWSSGRIVVKVPEGATDGPIEVTTAAAKKDATNDTYGPIISDFRINTTARPGICSVIPLAAKAGEVLVVSGVGFGSVQGGSRVQFLRAGSDCLPISSGESYDAGIVAPWGETVVQPKVPSVGVESTGTNYLVRTQVSGEFSNPVCMQVQSPDTGTLPRIEFISPTSGSVGQYVTVSGSNFGTSGKVKFFRSGQTAYGDTQFPAQCSNDTWKSDSIVVKVPAKFTVPADTPIALGDYALTVVRADNVESNAKTFTTDESPPAPGICRIDPDNGPEAVGVTLYGERFGVVPADQLDDLIAAHPDSIRFFENKNATSVPGIWTNSQVSTQVPSGAKTGPAVLRTYVGGTGSDSNGINFQVKDCRQAGANACGTETCCPDGACRADCGVSARRGGFAWQFSTGPVPIYPIVLEDATCQTSTPTITPSPSPTKAATDVCTNLGKISLRFSLPIEPASLDSNSVLLSKCGDGEAIAANCETVPTGPISLTDDGSGGGSRVSIGVTGLAPSTWYRLTLIGASSIEQSGVRSLPGEGRAAQPLDGNFDGKAGGNYSTTFRLGTVPCVVVAVDVQPEKGLIDQADETLSYEALPLTERCEIPDCAPLNVSWSSSDNTKATIPGGGPGACATAAAPVSETVPGPDIRIDATIDTKTDAGDLTVDYANPRVVAYGPKDCTEACPNTLPFAKFNTQMRTSGQGNILTSAHLHRCLNESCLSIDPQISQALFRYQDEDPEGKYGRTLFLEYTGLLAADTFYRVIIDGDAMSTSGASLTGLNFNNDSFSWIFRTREDGNPCGPQKIDMSPPKTTFRYIGQVGQVSAVPLTSPDKCSADGQLLTSASFNWNWSKSQTPAALPEAFTLVPRHPLPPPPALLDTTLAMPAGCSTQCLYTGSLPPGTPSCGNGGLPERGEACDTPGASGCGETCLRTGSSLVSCGNESIEASNGEECDEGADNGKSESGCSDKCLLTGAVSGTSVCGNRSIGLGESCDDGNTSGGDGCGPTCLLEGSKQNVPVCGNGRLETGEQCEFSVEAGGMTIKDRTRSAVADANNSDPKKASFPCDDACLLRGNPVICADPTGASCCGNGVIEIAKGENCDAASGNGKSGSGCSAKCTKTGAEPSLRAFCGDGVVTVKLSNGPVANEGGEECEAGGPDGRIDPTQVLTALAQCDARNSCVGTVKATEEKSTKSGEGRVSVECSCRQDSDCTVFDTTLSCGAGSCCFKRPTPPTIAPTGFDECRNALVTVTFDEPMSDGALTGNMFVVEDQSGCTVPGIAKGPIRSWISQTLRPIRELIGGLLGRSAQAADCPVVKGAFTHALIQEATGKKYTRSSFIPEDAYAAGGRYRVIVKGGAQGVKSANGVGYTESKFEQRFGTGPDLCKLDVVQVDPATELIQVSSRQHTFIGQAMANHNGVLEEIAPIADLYAWRLAWSMVPNDILEFKPTADSTTTPTINVQATRGKNGQVQLMDKATITANTIIPNQPVGTDVIGKSSITVFLCEYPWPARKADGTWTPYRDAATHFEWFYCRGNIGQTLLPELEQDPVQAQTTLIPGLLRFCKLQKETGEPAQPKACNVDADCTGGAGDKCLARDLFFRSADPQIRDAFGVRVFSNPDHLSPAAWYEQQKFKAAGKGIQIDGYDAIKDEQTTYVGAADKYGDPDLRSYVYVFGITANADPRTVAIYDQLSQNLRFNTNMTGVERVTDICKIDTQDDRDPANDSIVETATDTPIVCASDLDCHKAYDGTPTDLIYCDADKAKLRRDVRRWQDLITMSTAIEEVRAVSGDYPKVESGSYIRGMSTSLWPSWSAQLGAAGRVTDPLNQYNQCDRFGSVCSQTGRLCKSDAECDPSVADDKCRVRFEAATCYNPAAEAYICPLDSSVYQYRAIGGVDYELQAEFEYDVPWAGGCETTENQVSCIRRPGCRWEGTNEGCTSRFQIAPICSGLPTTDFLCSDDGSPCTVDSQCGGNASCVPPDSTVFGSAISATCGNGALEPGEECEIGADRFTADGCTAGGQKKERCSISCRWEEELPCPAPSVCGNGSIEIGETCDDGSQTGNYSRCRSGVAGTGCTKRCLNTAKVRTPPGFNQSRDIGPSCVSNSDCASGYVCTDRMNFCGDGLKQGSEVCDDGPENGVYGKCSWDCSGAGPRCGDQTLNGSEACDGNHQESAGVCVSGSVADSSTITDGAACTKDADCGAGKTCSICAPAANNIPQARQRSCSPANTVNQCQFASWSACKASGSCGNGKVEGSEQCDAGSGNSATGACLPNCRNNVCNDGFVKSGSEQCDNGASNGVSCIPTYGLTCNYCKNDCTIETVSGAYCGDARPTKPALDIPPETCDPGSVTAWCDRTYKIGDKPFGTGATRAAGPKACATDNDCAAGVCTPYVTTVPPAPVCENIVGQNRLPTPRIAARKDLLADMAALARHVISPIWSAYSDPSGLLTEKRLAELIPQADQPYCSFSTDGFCCSCEAPYAYDTVARKCVLGAGGETSVGESCHSANDCGDGEYCKNTEGQCIQYNTQCTPDPYSNTRVTSSTKFIDGSCLSCSNQCAGTSQKSPFFCGDTTLQPQFGELCEGVGDANATGPGRSETYYSCGLDCAYDASSGYCSDNVRQAGTVEDCDGADYTTSSGNGSAPTCSSLGWGAEGAVACGRGCRYYGGGCANGALSPGDVRIKVLWNSTASDDIDTHVILPSSSATQGVGYGASSGSVIADPHVWWSWDDTSASRGSSAEAGFAAPHGLELMTINWRNDGNYWSSFSTNAYKFYLYAYSDDGRFTNAKVIVCTYQTDPGADGKHQNCSRVFNGPGSASTGRYWHVFDLYGSNQEVPVISNVNKFGDCTCSSGACSRGACPAANL
jgi:cysteine-rich repeat protein